MIQPEQVPTATVTVAPQPLSQSRIAEQPKATVTVAPQALGVAEIALQPTAVVVAVDSDSMAGGYDPSQPVGGGCCC